jgi:hypothetical protein
MRRNQETTESLQIKSPTEGITGPLARCLAESVDNCIVLSETMGLVPENAGKTHLSLM